MKLRGKSPTHNAVGYCFAFCTVKPYTILNVKKTSVKPVYCLKGCAICDRVKSVVTISVERKLSESEVLMYAACLDHVDRFHLIKFCCNEERRSCKFETAPEHVIGCLLSAGCTLRARLHIPVTEYYVSGHKVCRKPSFSSMVPYLPPTLYRQCLLLSFVRLFVNPFL